MFDKVSIIIRAGDGGDGVALFRREKYVPQGGPDGGDGGDGGSVVLRAECGAASLRRYRQGRLYRAENGGRGGGSQKTGHDGAGLVLPVPVGSVIFDDTAGEHIMLADLERPSQELIVARGGKGGLGNTHFTSSTNQAPLLAQRGEPGAERRITLELRLLADAAIIGLPNAGKSSLLCRVSAARPKVADYPFTTLQPVLGVVEIGDCSFILAEVPGLIEGAHQGKGLGTTFLRHAARTRLLIHLIDGSSLSPVADMQKVNCELAAYDVNLAVKPQIVAVNKLDLTDVRERRREIEQEFEECGISPAFFISAATGEGVRALMQAAAEALSRTAPVVVEVESTVEKVFRPRPRRPSFGITREGQLWRVSAPEMERIVAGSNTDDPEVRRQLAGLFKRRGVYRALTAAGARPGDAFSLAGVEFQL